MYPRNAASPERVAIGPVVQISDGAVQTSGVSVKVLPQGGTASAGGGTISYEEGIVHYLPTQAETNYTSLIIIAYKASCIPASTTIVTTASATSGTVLLAPVTHTSAVIPTVSTLTGHTAQSGDAFARLGAPAGASISADVAAVKTDTGNLVTRITSTLFSGITSMAQWLGLLAGKQVGNSTARTEIRATGAGAGTFDETTDSQEAIRDNMGTAQTGDAFARLGAPAGASVSADVAAIKTQTAAIEVDTQDIQARLPAALVSGRIDASVGAMATGVLTATAIAADAITDAKVASDVTIASVTGSVGSVTGAVGSVTGNVGGNVVGSVASVTGNVGGNVVGSVGSVTGNVTGSVGSVASGGITRASLAADTGLQPIRSNTAQAGASTSITLDASASSTTNFYNNDLVLITGGTGVGQARYITAYNGATKVATVAAWATNPDNTSTFAILPADSIPGATAPTAAQVADAVWDEALSGHLTAGSTGEALNAAGAAGDPWITALPGSYTAGQAGYIVGTNLNATISSRLASASYTAPLDAAGTRSAVGLASANLDTQLAAATTVTAGAIRSAVGLASANLDTQLSTIDTVVDAVLVDTAEIGAAGAGLTALATAANLATVDTVVDAIKLKTDNLPAAPAATSDIPSASTNASAVLGATVEGSVTVVQSLRLANAALGGKASGLATTNPKYRDLGDTKDRIDATVDADGNRTAVTRDLT